MSGKASGEQRPTSLYAKLARASAQLANVPKAGINTFHGYHYVTEADVVHRVRTALLENGLCFWSSVVDQQRDGDFALVCVEFVVTDVDTGESLSSLYWGSAVDKKGDKALFKAYAGATKYWALKCFLIPALGDDPEADHHVDEDAAAAAPAPPPPKSPKSAKASPGACVACGTVLPPAVRTFSERRFGKPLCIGCQKGATA